MWLTIEAASKPVASTSAMVASSAALPAVNAPCRRISFQTRASISTGTLRPPPVSPASTRVPRRRTEATEEASASGLPLTSTTTSAMAPPVKSATASATSASSASITASAPQARHRASRSASAAVPLTSTWAAPAQRAAQVQARPCWPGPWISTVSPKVAPPCSTAHW